MVEEARLARLEAEGRRKKKGAVLIGGGALAVVLGSAAVAYLGGNVAIGFGVLLTLCVLGGAFYLGSTLDAHGDEPPLRHG